MIFQTDERQRKKLDSLSDGLNRLLMEQPKMDLPPLIDGPNPLVEDALKTILRKIGVIDDTLKHDFASVNNEVSFSTFTLD